MVREASVPPFAKVGHLLGVPEPKLNTHTDFRGTKECDVSKTPPNQACAFIKDANLEGLRRGVKSGGSYEVFHCSLEPRAERVRFKSRTFGSQTSCNFVDAGDHQVTHLLLANQIHKNQFYVSSFNRYPPGETGFEVVQTATAITHTSPGHRVKIFQTAVVHRGLGTVGAQKKQKCGQGANRLSRNTAILHTRSSSRRID